MLLWQESRATCANPAQLTIFTSVLDFDADPADNHSRCASLLSIQDAL